jgi:hypothetical protein
MIAKVVRRENIWTIQEEITESTWQSNLADAILAQA